MMRECHTAAGVDGQRGERGAHAFEQVRFAHALGCCQGQQRPEVRADAHVRLVFSVMRLFPGGSIWMRSARQPKQNKATHCWMPCIPMRCSSTDIDFKRIQAGCSKIAAIGRESSRGCSEKTRVPESALLSARTPHSRRYECSGK